MASTTTRSRYISGTRVQAWSSQRLRQEAALAARHRERANVYRIKASTAGEHTAEGQRHMDRAADLDRQAHRVEREARAHTPCPRCWGAIPNQDHRGEYAGALSRLDNSTEICSECGTLEAMFNLSFPGKTLPDFDEPLL